VKIWHWHGGLAFLTSSSLQALPTKEGAKFLVDENSKHLTTEEFKEKYDASTRAQSIRASNEGPLAEKDKLTKEQQQYFGMKYRVSTWKSVRLVVGREMLLWWRDRYQIKARLMQGTLRYCAIVFISAIGIGNHLTASYEQILSWGLLPELSFGNRAMIRSL
jgi:hypothetical protein